MHFQVALLGETNLAEDVSVNNLYFSGSGTGDDPEGVADGIKAAYDTFKNWIQSFYNAGILIKWYDDAGGQPLGQKLYTYSPTGGANPTEVALCLSYAAVDDPEASTPRRRGRIYLPVGQVASLRPPDVMISALLNFGEDLAEIGTATLTTWNLWSQRDQSAHKIESIWVDDSWDTQRRRGLAPTKKVTRDVQ